MRTLRTTELPDLLEFPRVERRHAGCTTAVSWTGRFNPSKSSAVSSRASARGESVLSTRPTEARPLRARPVLLRRLRPSRSPTRRSLLTREKMAARSRATAAAVASAPFQSRPSPRPTTSRGASCSSRSRRGFKRDRLTVRSHAPCVVRLQPLPACRLGSGATRCSCMRPRFPSCIRSTKRSSSITWKSSRARRTTPSGSQPPSGLSHGSSTGSILRRMLERDAPRRRKKRGFAPSLARTFEEDIELP